MEFPFNINAVLLDRITLLHSDTRKKNYMKDVEIAQMVDEMGVASAKAQSLKAPITSYSKLQSSSEQCIYLLKESSSNQGQGSLIGFIKTGKKRLFLTDSKGLLHEVEPVCILDFYVHESQQRKGYGKILFEQVLQRENVEPFEVAIDRPSSKFLSFLKKHYQLQSHVQQNNNFVVFDKFFTTCVHVDYGHKKHKRLSLPTNLGGSFMNSSSTLVTSRHSLSPIKNDDSSLQSKGIYIPINSINTTTNASFTSSSPSANGSAITNSSTFTPSTDNRHSISPWNISKIKSIKPPVDTNENCGQHKVAPYLNMRNNLREKKSSFDCFDWGCGPFSHSGHSSNVKYSRYVDSSNVKPVGYPTHTGSSWMENKWKKKSFLY